MKKFILIFSFLVLLVISTIFGYAIPTAFHLYIHQELVDDIANSKSDLIYKEVSFSNHQSKFKTKSGINEYEVTIDTHSSLYPLNNYVQAQFLDLKTNKNFEVKIYADIQTDGAYFKLVLNDFEEKIKEDVISAKRVNFYFGPFTGEENFEGVKIEALDVLRNKRLYSETGELKIESGNQSIYLKDLIFSIGNEVQANNLKITSHGKVGEFNGIIDMKPQNFKQSEFELDIKNFKIDEIKKLNPQTLKTPNPMMLAFSLMNIIEFPVEVKFNSKGLIENKPTQLNFAINVKSKNVLDLQNNYTLDLYSKNTPENLAQVCIGFIATTYAKEAVEFYSPNVVATNERNPKEKIETQQKIKDIVIEDLSSKQTELMLKINEMGYSMIDNDMHIFDLKYSSGTVIMNGKKMNMQEAMIIPNKVLKELYLTPEGNQLDQLLNENGIYPIKKSI